MTRFALALACGTLALAQPQISIDKPDRAVKQLARSATRYTDYNAALLNAVLFAWETDREHTTVPHWFETTRFDFVADGGGVDPRPALRAALEQKFQFTAQWQPRSTDVWVLRKGKDGPAPKTVDPNAPGLAGTSFAPGALDGTYTVDYLARLLQFNLNEMVIDESKSGDARYRITAHWTPQDTAGLSSALRENGFELVRERRDIKFLVIDAPAPPDTAPAVSSYPCEPASSLAAAIEALPSAGDLSRAWEARMAPRRKLMEESGGVFAGMAAGDAIRDKPYLAADWDWALAQYRKLSDPLAAAFLEARLIAGLEPAKARTLLEQDVKRTPEYPWAHLGLAELARTAKEAEPELRTFLKLCPSSLAAAAVYGKAADVGLLHDAAEAVNRAIGARQDDTALEAESQVWRMRRKIGEAGLVAGQLTAIRALNRGADERWLRVLTLGYQLGGDEKSTGALVDEVLAKYPGSQYAFETTRARWAEKHRTSAADYATELSRALDEWAFSWPQLPQIVFERWNALSAIASTPDDALESAALFYLQVAKLYPDLQQAVPAPLSVAGVLGGRKLRTADIQAWTEQGIAQAREEERFRLEAEDSQVKKAAQQRLAGLAKK